MAAKSVDLSNLGGGNEKKSSQVQQSKDVTASSSYPQRSDPWKVPKLPKKIELDAAIDDAFKRASSYMNKVLKRDDLMVEIQHKEDERIGVVTDQFTGEEVQKYEGNQLLKLYAYNQKPLGAVIDGSV